ncbi:hypothetical protein [Acetobacter thailandicus]|uniref:hypothetical protein n=1 Tax=Acetobacter thailandicus TaxID=1502842 RepID=UPI001BAC77E9|nr:hypothetical protein [Acetobacter thailandicus]MBS0981008.1 hypothetical protein [Acetobacter thailandicus]
MSIDYSGVSRARGYFLSSFGHTQLCWVAFSDRLEKLVGQEKNSVWIALLNNMCFALEVGLKSFLCLKNIDEKTLSSRKYGHNLEVLYDEAMKYGLSQLNVVLKEKEFCDSLEKIVDLFGKDYASFNYRYIEEEKLSMISKDSIGVVLNFLLKLNEYLDSETNK